MLLRYLLALLLMTTLSGCYEDTPDKPKQLITENKYVSLLVELQLIRSYKENAETDSLTVDSLTSEVFEKYNVTQEGFQRSHKYYQKFPEQQQARIEKAIEQLKMDQVVDTSRTPRGNNTSAN